MFLFLTLFHSYIFCFFSFCLLQFTLYSYFLFVCISLLIVLFDITEQPCTYYSPNKTRSLYRPGGLFSLMSSRHVVSLDSHSKALGWFLDCLYINTHKLWREKRNILAVDRISNQKIISSSFVFIYHQYTYSEKKCSILFFSFDCFWQQHFLIKQFLFFGVSLSLSRSFSLLFRCRILYINKIITIFVFVFYLCS